LARVKQTRHEADCSPPPTAKVKNDWNHTSTKPLYLHRLDTKRFKTEGFLRIKRHPRKCFAESVISLYVQAYERCSVNNSCMKFKESEPIRTL
jgi:hypothetical protein